MGKTDLSKYSNKEFKPGASVLIRVLWYFINVCLFHSKFLPLNALKVVVLRLFGAQVGKGVVIKPGVNIKFPWKLNIGNHVWVGENVWIDNLEKVSIGNHCCLSQGAFLLTGNHNYKKNTFDLITREIKLEEGVWVGAMSVVCPGVICHSHALLTVGSVAVSNLEAYSIYQGNPAVKIRERTLDEN